MSLINSPNRWPSVPGLVIFLLLMIGVAAAQHSGSDKQAAAPVGNNYHIRGGDKLNIKFLYQPELNELGVVVRPDGYIALSMIDEVLAQGLTISELKASIEKAYSETLLNPVVSINLVEFVAPRIYVGGQVAKPGSFELRAGQTLIQSIVLAGGFTREANRKLILHARPDGDGKLKMTTFDMARMLKESTPGQEVQLLDGDYVFVPDSKLSKVSRVIDAFQAFVPNFGIGIGYR